MPDVTVTFELKDGRELECRYWYFTTRGVCSGRPEDCYPDETEIGDPDYFLDGKWISIDSLPKGLYELAEEMHGNNPPGNRFRYVETPFQRERDDY